MIRATVLAAFILAGSAPCLADPLKDRQGAEPFTRDLHISAKETSLAPAQQPQITATITNKGSAPVTLVLPGDGSESGWRTPVVGFSSIKVGKDKPKHPADVPRYRGGRCGNINALIAGKGLCPTGLVSGSAGVDSLWGRVCARGAQCNQLSAFAPRSCRISLVAAASGAQPKTVHPQSAP
jgi:hypothetical protein